MLVKARKQIVTNPQAVHEELSSVLGAESEVGRMKDYLDVVPVPLVFVPREIRRNGNETYSGKQIKTEEQDV